MAKKKDHSDTKRNRDLATIKDLFSIFPRPLVDRVLDEALADRILVDHIDCLIGAEEIVRSTLFHLYDGELRQLLDDFFYNWNAAWEVGRSSHHDHLHRGVATLILCDTDLWERWEKHKEYLEHVAKAQSAMAGLTKHMHEAYPDFDIAESDREASRRYREMEERVEKRAAELWGESKPDQEPTAEEKQPVSDEQEDGGVNANDARDYLIRVGQLKAILNDKARGGQPLEKDYAKVRDPLVTSEIRDGLPSFVLICHTLQEWWQFIKPKFPTWKERTNFLQIEFGPLLTSLEQGVVPSTVKVSVTPPRPDLVLVTVNEHETQAIHEAFLRATGKEAAPITLGARLYHNLGSIDGTTVYHAISEMGSGGSGGMQQTVEKAISALNPGAVIAVGIAFGVNEEGQEIGDIIVSKLLRLYELQRVGKGSKIILRGARPDSSPRLMSHFRGFSQTKWRGQRVRIGVLLTGDKLVDNVDYRNQLVKFEAEAEGGEMEGAGLYVSSYDNKVDWIVIKAICDWADGNKSADKTARQKLAAKNAAEFVVESLKYAPLHHPDSSPKARTSHKDEAKTEEPGVLELGTDHPSVRPLSGR